jgi:putative tricarboxylic transport membrane protein
MLAIGGALFSILVLIAPHKPKDDPDIDLSQMSEYNYGQAIALLGIMWVYAFMLLRLEFLASTFLFLMLGSLVLGERRWVAVIFASSIAIVSIWYLVQEVLGIFLRSLPAIMGN